MTELEMKTEAEVEDFTDELSDEALDRAEGAAYGTGLYCCAGVLEMVVVPSCFSTFVADRSGS